MEVRYDVYLEDENENENDFDAPMKRLELIFSHITEEEKEILEKYDFKYEYTEDNKIKLIDEDCAIYYTVEIDDEDKGIAPLEITTPHFAPYYYACFNILWLNDDEAYWWLDEENSTVTDILKNLEKSLTYFINS